MHQVRSSLQYFLYRCEYLKDKTDGDVGQSQNADGQVFKNTCYPHHIHKAFDHLGLRAS